MKHFTKIVFALSGALVIGFKIGFDANLKEVVTNILADMQKQISELKSEMDRLSGDGK